MTIRHLLTLTAGWPYTELGDRIYTLPYLLRQPRVREPGEQFEYDDIAPHLVSAILTRVTGTSAAAYAKRELFEPLGMWRDLATWPDAPGAFHRFGAWPADGLPWKCDGEGISTGGFGAHCTLRDMARFGLLYASGGCWEGRQLIPANYFEESTRPHSPGGSPSWMPYGYLWWLPVWHRGRAMLAAGWGGQNIYVNADVDLVIAVACANRPGGPMHNGNVINRYLLPAVRDWASPARTPA
jgi:CubicO group peptidase (beta-lactamase class C family)